MYSTYEDECEAEPTSNKKIMVLGGGPMEIVHVLRVVYSYMREAVVYSQERPVLVDRFLEDATEIDVDCLADGDDVLIAGIMEHIEEAGVHSGDSSCVLPAFSIGEEQLATIRDYTIRLARALNVVGLMNTQYAIQNGKVYVLEVNPRASRTVPYVSKATGVPLARLAVRLMTGGKLREIGYSTGTLDVKQYCVKSPVFPFNKFPGVDPILGPEMRSTGEVMGIGETFGEAFAKAQLSAGQSLPERGAVFLSVNDRQKQDAVEVARKFAELGFRLVATRGTAFTLKAAGIDCRTVLKVNEGRPNVVDLIKAGELSLIVNTPAGAHSFFDEKSIRRAAVTHRVPCITTLSGAKAAASGIAARRQQPVRVWSLQQMHGARAKA
jgi:carbamoyl-phosphate synthase large subunit